MELPERPRVLAGGLYERVSGAAGQPLTGYRRRTPERTVLHELVTRHAQTMFAELRAADSEGGGLPRYPMPTNANVLTILDRIMRRVARRLANEAIGDIDEDAAPDVLAQVQAEAATTWRSPTDGKPTVRGAERLRAWCVASRSRCLHAGVGIAEHDREALERLCRYGARPAVALDRLAWTHDGRISYKLKRPWPDGRTHLPLEE